MVSISFSDEEGFEKQARVVIGKRQLSAGIVNPFNMLITRHMNFFFSKNSLVKLIASPGRTIDKKEKQSISNFAA